MHTILGINGSVGPGLAEVLLQRGIPVRGVSRRPSSGKWTSITADVTNPADVLSAADGADVVYLLVGLPYQIKVWRRDWPLIIENVIRACEATGAKLVFLDNVYAYGLVEGPMTEETPMRPCSEKGKVRKQLDLMLLEAFSRGMRGCIAKAADFYGPDSPTSALTPTLFSRYAAGKSALLLGRPDKIHTYTYVPDIGPALAILGTDDRADGQVWHLPTAQAPWTGADWARAAAEAFGVPARYQGTPTFVLRLLGLFNPLMRELAEMNYQFTHDYVLSSAKFERVFGMRPTPVEQGLAATVAHYKN